MPIRLLSSALLGLMLAGCTTAPEAPEFSYVDGRIPLTLRSDAVIAAGGDVHVYFDTARGRLHAETNPPESWRVKPTNPEAAAWLQACPGDPHGWQLHSVELVDARGRHRLAGAEAVAPLRLPELGERLATHLWERRHSDGVDLSGARLEVSGEPLVHAAVTRRLLVSSPPEELAPGLAVRITDAYVGEQPMRWNGGLALPLRLTLELVNMGAVDHTLRGRLAGDPAEAAADRELVVPANQIRSAELIIPLDEATARELAGVRAEARREPLPMHLLARIGRDGRISRDLVGFEINAPIDLATAGRQRSVRVGAYLAVVDDYAVAPACPAR